MVGESRSGDERSGIGVEVLDGSAWVALVGMLISLQVFVRQPIRG